MELKLPFSPVLKFSNQIRSVKDNTGLRTPGVYETLRECGLSYTGRTGHTMDEWYKEHRDLYL